MEKFDNTQLDFILGSAIQAPSADNHHNISFQVANDIIKMRYIGRELSQNSGYKRILALLSLGSVAENIKIAASRFHIGTETKILSDISGSYIEIRGVQISDNTKVDDLLPFIQLRHTNRHIFFKGPKLTTNELNEIQDAVAIYQSSCLFWLNESKQRKQVLHLMRLAETERFNNQRLHQEMFSAIRFDIGWQASCEEGLPPGTLEVESFLKGFFAQLRYWSVMRFAKIFGIHHILGLRACYLPCKLAPNLGFLAVKSLDNESVFNAGRSFQRLWLTLTKQGKSLQPMPASAIYALQGAEREGIPLNLHQKLSEGWKAAIGDGVMPLMLFRVGKAKPPSVVTKRHSVIHYLEK